MIKLIIESNDSNYEQSPKQLFNKIISKLRKYAKEHDCYMTIEKFGMYDNSGDIYICTLQQTGQLYLVLFNLHLR